MMPKVTVAIPTRNRAKFLGGAIESVLKQTYSNIEVVVSDNASTDETSEVISGFNDNRLLAFRQRTNIGLGGNFNACLDKATGDYFLLLPDDDLLEPTAIEALIKPFVSGTGGREADKEKIGMVYGQTQTIDDYGRVTGYSKGAPEYETALDLCASMFLGKREPYLCSILVRTKDLCTQGGFDEARFSLALDAAAWLQIILRRGSVVFVPQIMSSYRRHSIAITATAKISQWELADRSLIDLCENFFRNNNDIKAANKIKKIGKKFISRKVACLISLNVRNGGLRLKALQQYLVYYKYFLGFYGFYVLVVNLFKVFVPDKLFYGIKKLVSPAPY